MAREIKLIVDSRGQLHVRGIGDKLAVGEVLAAARWQESDGVKVAHFGHKSREFLSQIRDKLEIETGVPDLWDATDHESISHFEEWEDTDDDE